MGLDIYFYKQNRKKAEAVKEHNEKVEKKVAAIRKEINATDDEAKQEKLYEKLRKAKEGFIQTQEEIAYFRKVNFLMEFFNYEGNCEDLLINKCQIEVLVEACEKVLKAKNDENFEEIAEENLPTQSGFFFGSTDYDNYYLEDVEEVKMKFEEILKNTDFDEEDIIMYCWW